jgi:hypothetical protein
MTVSSITEGTIEVGHGVHGGVPGTVVRVNVSVGDYLVTPVQTIPSGTPLTSSFLMSTRWTALSGARRVSW